jgi:hypothetical protein
LPIEWISNDDSGANGHSQDGRHSWHWAMKLGSEKWATETLWINYDQRERWTSIKFNWAEPMTSEGPWTLDDSPSRRDVLSVRRPGSDFSRETKIRYFNEVRSHAKKVLGFHVWNLKQRESIYYKVRGLSQEFSCTATRGNVRQRTHRGERSRAYAWRRGPEGSEISCAE